MNEANKTKRILRKILLAAITITHAPLVLPLLKKPHGLKNLPEKQNFVLAVNHASYLDPVFVAATFMVFKREKLFYLANEKVCKNFFFKPYCEAGNALPINQKLGLVEKENKKTLDETLKRLSRGESLVTFPEGHRSTSGEIQEGKTGAVRIALLSKKPLVPARIKGTHEILPKGKKIPNLLHRAQLAIGKPIVLDKRRGETEKQRYRRLTEELMEKIRQL